MPKLRVLSGNDVLLILNSFGFEYASQRGSHGKVQRTLPGIKACVFLSTVR
jgi:predicted RNA binding protein YcfA (HicA-like mRNA interferase family)